MGRGEGGRRHVRHEPEQTKRPRFLSVSVIALLISGLSLLVSGAALYLTRQDARNANRARRERAEYLSYRLGVDVGLCAGGSQYQGVPSLAPSAALARDCFRTSLKAIGGDLGLGIGIPESLDKIAIERIKMRIHDTCGQRAVDSFALGVDLGLAEGELLPWAVADKTTHSPPPMLEATSVHLAELTRLVNKQLEILGFQQRVQMDDQSGATSFDRLNKLDEMLVTAWDDGAGRWRTATRAVITDRPGK